MPNYYPATMEWSDEGNNDIRIQIHDSKGLAITFQRLEEDVRRHHRPVCAILTDIEGNILFLGLWVDGEEGFAAYQPHDTDTGKHWGMIPALWSLGGPRPNAWRYFHLCLFDCPVDTSAMHCIPFPLVREIAQEWLETGALSQRIAWGEEIPFPGSPRMRLSEVPAASGIMPHAADPPHDPFTRD